MPAEEKRVSQKSAILIDLIFRRMTFIYSFMEMRKLICFALFFVLTGFLRVYSMEDNGSVIKGRVTDQNGNALTGASVTIENSFIGVHTNAKGEFSLPGLKDGNYALRFSFIGFEPQVREVRLKEETVINISLQAKTFLTEEVFVSATRAGEDTPLTYSAVNKETISRNNVTRDIPYMLSYTPSVTVSSDAGTGVGYTNINIRGADIKRINVTIDGIPVNDAESHGVWWVDLPDLASSADNIQIQRGVGTSTNGAGAFGATINFQTSNLNREPYAEFNSLYGSYNTSKNTLNLGTGLINNKFTFDARLSKIWSDGYIDRAFSDLKSFSLSGTMYGEKSILKLMIISGLEHTYQAWYGVPKDSLATNRTYNQYSYKNETDNYWQDNYQLHFSKELNSNLYLNAALHFTKGKGYYENLKKDSEFSSYNLPDFILKTDTITSSDFIIQKWLDNVFYGFIYSLNYRKNKINTVFGGGWNQYSGNHFGDVVWARIVTFNGEKYRWYKGTGDKKDLNTFLKINYLLKDGLNLFTDLQLRVINYSIAGYDDNLKDVTQNHKYFFFNPKAGILYNLNEKQKIYASFGISHREPDRGNFTDADPGRTPVPEKLLDFEAGYEFRTSKIHAKGNFYYMNYRDQLILTGEINNVGSPILTNVSKSYRQGIEIETGVRILKNLSWYGNITLSRNIIPLFIDYTDNWDTGRQDEVTLRNKTISFSPGIIGGSVLDYDLYKNFNLSLSTKYVGKQYIDNTQNAERMLDAFFVQNMSLSYSIRNKKFKELTCQFEADNLFNRKYETNAWVYKYNEGGSLHVSDGYFPQAGISYMLRLDVKF
jgi:iron complex outermembrane receptor protein